MDSSDLFFDESPRITYADNPTTTSWVIEPMFSIDHNQNIRIWQIGFDGQSLRIRHGVVKTGNYQYEMIEIIAKSNRNIQEQAILEARSRYELKYRQDNYRPAGYEFSTETEPELANKYELKKIKYWPVATMPKIDGIRCRFKLDNNNQVVAVSRNNKVFPHLGYLDDELKTLFMYLPAGSLIESEIYHPNFSYNDIQSVVMATKNINPLLSIMGCYIFDIYFLENPPFEIRYNLMVNAYSRLLEEGHRLEHLRFLSSTLAYDDRQLRSFHDYYVDLGLEGLIIHKIAGLSPTEDQILSSIYKPGRSNNLLKFKSFDDEEATVIKVSDGIGRESGLAVFEVKNDKGIIYSARPAFSFEERKNYFSNPQLALGRRGTVHYFGLSEYGVPRQPVFKNFRDLAV